MVRIHQRGNFANEFMNSHKTCRDKNFLHTKFQSNTGKKNLTGLLTEINVRNVLLECTSPIHPPTTTTPSKCWTLTCLSTYQLKLYTMRVVLLEQRETDELLWVNHYVLTSAKCHCYLHLILTRRCKMCKLKAWDYIVSYMFSVE